MAASKPFAKLGSDEQRAMRDWFKDAVGVHRASDLLSARSIANHAVFGGMGGKPLHKVVMDAMAVRDSDAPVITDRKGNPEPDPDLRDAENVPLPEVPVTYENDATARLATVEYRTAVADYVDAEVKPWVADAWVDHDRTKLGYEIPLTRHFYKYTPPRPLAEIDAEIKQLEAEIQALLAEVTE